jgi:hypothetical protein
MATVIAKDERDVLAVTDFHARLGGLVLSPRREVRRDRDVRFHRP